MKSGSSSLVSGPLMGAIFGSLFALTSCQHHIHSGTLVTEDQVQLISSKSPSAHEIEELLGQPNIIPDFNPNRWYYVHREMTKRAFLSPSVVSQRIVWIDFENQKVKSIEAIDNSHRKDIRIVDEYIRARGSEKSAIQEYIGNIGRFHKGKKRELKR